jgi:predicted RNase H-like HicB family nuclease
MRAKFLVIVERGSTNYSAYSPDLPGCIASGKTIEETLDSMRSAIDFHIEGIIENGDPLPIPRTLSSYVNDTDEISDSDILTSVETDIPQLAAA